MGTVALNATAGVSGPEEVIQFRDVAGKPISGRVRKFLVTFSASYATGGDTIPLASLGLRNVHKILVEPPDDSALGDLSQNGLSVSVSGTPSVPTLQAFDAFQTEVVAATNLSTRSAYIWFIGD